MMTRMASWTRYGWALAWLSVSSPALHAQDTLDSLDSLMQEVMKVTAQKRLQSVYDVPASVVAFSAGDLAAARVQDASQLEALVPGLVFDRIAGFSLVYLRGIGSDFFAPGVNHSVAVYVDGVYVPFNQVMDQSFLDVDRVEVIRGPQGTLYGRNATGGAINVITRKPSDAPSLDLSVQTMNFGGRGAAARVSGPIASHLGASLALDYDTRNPWLRNVQGPRLNDDRRRAARGKLYYHSDAGMEAELGLHYLLSDRPEQTALNQFEPNSVGAFASLVTGGLLPNGLQSDQRGVVFNDAPNFDATRDRGVSLRVRVPFAAFDLVSISGFSDVLASAGADFDGTSAPLVFFTADMTDQLFTQEIQLVSNKNRHLDWLVGAYFLDSTSAFDTFNTPSPTVPGAINRMFNRSDATAYAAFVDATYRFNASWAATLGGRYSQEDVNHQPIRINGSSLSAPADAQWSNFSPRLGVQYRVGEHRLYATVSRGFKSGSFNLASPTDLAAVSPETLTATELGWKTQLPEHHIRLEAALFNYDYKDLQVSFSQTQTSPVALRNAAKAVVRGVELAMSATPRERLNVHAGLSWLADADYERYPDGSAFLPAPIGFAITPADYSGNRMARTPEFTFNVGLDYTHPLAAGTLVLIGGWYHSDGYFFSAQNTADNEQSAFDLLNASIGFHGADDRWSVSAWGKNLTDTRYFASKAVNALGLVGTYAEPRMYGIELKYRIQATP